MYNYGFLKVASACPKTEVANIKYNTEEIKNLIIEADKNDAALIVFPELSLTSYTCADLFGQELLVKNAEYYLNILLNCTQKADIIAIIGMPLAINQALFNCSVIIQKGKILGIVPKTFIPNYKEFYEKRWFTSGNTILNKFDNVTLCNQIVPFGNLIFKCANINNFSFGVEICEDIWSPIPPSSLLSINGATIIANLSASNEIVSKAPYRHNLIANQSARCICGYIYSSCGVHESTTDLVFSGECIIAENGALLKTSERFNRSSNIIYSEIDVQRIAYERQSNKTFADSQPINRINFDYRTVEFTYNPIRNKSINFERFIDSLPFVPNNPITRNERCEEIFNIQVAGLAKRLEHTGCKNSVIGISGGLDSTLALLVTAKAYDLLSIDRKNIITITMPGFGTTDRTLGNAINLCKSLGTSLKQIDIIPACLQHFKDIDHDISIHDVTYENVQARERTQILMDTANKLNGLVIGTGDLSELALGWCTYNGDHMSMYAVNCSIPKTLVKSLVEWVSKNGTDQHSTEILFDIIDTPVSPELLPPDDNGKITQKTEDIVGPYELHDFFLYHMIKYGAEPKKILFLAKVAFGEKYSTDIINKWLKAFYRRFFTQQFKRSCIPDGPKVGTISLSPRGDWRMPSDSCYEMWISELD